MKHKFVVILVYFCLLTGSKISLVIWAWWFFSPLLFSPEFWLLKTPQSPSPCQNDLISLFFIFHFSFHLFFFFGAIRKQKAVVLTLLAGWWKHGPNLSKHHVLKKVWDPNGTSSSYGSGTKLILHPRSSLTTPPSSPNKAKKQC
jgi:hypothetical protein